ncbi:RNA polymerase III transcription factor IIIC subunit-domain-containing protein [Crassisporium funariophilum]|nr:RNA polymerase III transcription factor IIIC subunit-domain-containing protein [Crassisporium funariophilum]
MDSQTTSSPVLLSSPAQEKSLPQCVFYSIEYPGYVLPSSVSQAVQNLGGQCKVDHAFRRTSTKTQALLELSLRPGNPFAHPVPGDVVGTNNLLLKVVKKKRKTTVDNPLRPADGTLGEYTAEIAGVLAKTARFRSMVDFQYYPDMADPVAKLRQAMDKMDVDALCSYIIPIRDSDKTSRPLITNMRVDDEEMNLDPQLRNISQTPDTSRGNQLSHTHLRLFPPPLFSRQTIPQGYNFKANTASMISTAVDEETGEERKRLINRMRWKGYGPASITFSDAHVPDEAPKAVQEGRSQINDSTLKKLEALFVDRPIWTRMSLFNQFSAAEARDILNSKLLLPLCCYVFQDGPWRDTLVRFSYDPRQDSNSRFYQRLYFRNANHPIARPSVTTRRQDRSASNDQSRGQDKDLERKRRDNRYSHIFDGQTLTKETAAFQLCDIVDPMLKKMIEDSEGLRETCNERDGWYTTHTFEQIKMVLRHKFFSLLEGHPASDEECHALLLANEGSTKAAISQRNQKLRAGKHNMAKGALRPEDAAAMRLRATLDRNMKSFQSQR